MNQVHYTLLKNCDRSKAAIIFGIILTVYLFTAGGYMFSGDERTDLDFAIQIVEQKPVDGYQYGVTHIYNASNMPICYNGVLCGITTLGQAVTFMPFVIVEKILHPISFPWYNQTSARTFTTLFYGPIITALSVAVFYLIVRQFGFQDKTSITTSFVYGLASMAWPYSQTAFNLPPMILFALCGFLYLVKFEKERQNTMLIISGIFYALAFHVREDALLFVFVIVPYILIESIRKKYKVRNVISFLAPVIGGLIVFGFINFVRFHSFFETGYGQLGSAQFSTPILIGLYGLLFGPGFGLIVYCPIVITAIVSFFHFYRKEKKLSLLLLSFFVSYLFFYSTASVWSGFLAWGPRYLLPVVPFLLIPLAATIQNNNDKLKFKIFILSSIILGAFVEIAKLPSDLVPLWWCKVGGLLCLANGEFIPIISLYNPAYSSLINLIKIFPTKEPFFLLYHLLGPTTSVSITLISIVLLSFLLLRIIRRLPVSQTKVSI